MLPSALAYPLAAAALSPIQNVLTHGGPRTPAPRGEVSAVRTMTLDGFDAIAATWSPILKRHGYQIDLKAVFCHSRPWVTFPRPTATLGPPATKPDGTCELADLLVVIDHVDRTTLVSSRRAVLVQAKLLKAGGIKPSGTEWVQHDLLAWLPRFTFVDAGYDLRSRDLKTAMVGDPGCTAEYGGIDLTSSPAQWRNWLPSSTPPPFVDVVEFAEYLGQMAVGSPGFSREAIPGGSDDWSFTVDELLSVTAAKLILQSNPLVKRGNNNVVGFATHPYAMHDPAITSIDEWGGGVVLPPDGYLDEWSEGPISTVHLTIGPSNRTAS